MRRRRSTQEQRSHGKDVPKRTYAGAGLAVDERLDHLEILLRDVLDRIEVNAKRLNAVQAQLDYLVAHLRTV